MLYNYVSKNTEFNISLCQDCFNGEIRNNDILQSLNFETHIECIDYITGFDAVYSKNNKYNLLVSEDCLNDAGYFYINVIILNDDNKIKDCIKIECIEKSKFNLFLEINKIDFNSIKSNLVLNTKALEDRKEYLKEQYLKELDKVNERIKVINEVKKEIFF